MKKYKLLISILLISMLTSVGMASAAKPTPGPNPEQIQDQRLTNLEYNVSTLQTNENLQLINNADQQNSIDSMKIQINNLISALHDGLSALASRVTNLENNPYPAIYYEDYYAKQFYSGQEEINSLTFNLKNPAYLKVETTGWFQFQSTPGDCAYFNFYIDNIPGAGRTFCGFSVSGTMIYGEGDFAINRVFYMDAGQHTVRVYGKRTLSVTGMLNSGAEITVIADDKGSITNPYVSTPATINGIKTNGMRSS